MITIVSQDGVHQYDEEGRAITTWHEKYCDWIINPEFEDEDIDWQPDENGITEFPRGCTLAEYKEWNPDCDERPDVEVTWYWDPEGYKKAFKADLDPKSSPAICSRYWGHIMMTKEEAIERVGHYCDFNKFAFRTVVKYNGEVIFDGKLEGSWK